MKIVLYTDQPILAIGLQSALQPAGYGIAIVCASVPDLMHVLGNCEADMVLLDHTREINFDALSFLRRAVSRAKVVLMVEHIETAFAFQAMGLGIHGILRKTLPADMIVKCVEKILDGELWFEKALTDEFLRQKRVSLTQREGQLIVLLVRGLKNKEIATALYISEGTVKVYMSRLFQKLGVKDRFELALFGLKNMSSLEPHGEHESIVQGLRSIVLNPTK